MINKKNLNLAVKQAERKIRSSVQNQKASFNSDQIDEIALPTNQKPNEIPQFEPKRAVNSHHTLEEITLKQEDLEKVAIIYDLIRELQREFDPDLDKTLADQFDDHVKNIMFDLSSKLKNELPSYLINTNITKAKYALCEICFMKVIDFSTTIDPRFVNVLEGVHDSHAMIFKEMSSIINYLHSLNLSHKEKLKEAEQVLEMAERFEKENQVEL